MSSFHLFPQLPLELRQRIWELSIEPREVAIGPLWNKVAARLPQLQNWPSPPPAAFRACWEAQSYLQKHYVKAFASRTPCADIWVNFDVDTIYIEQLNLIDIGADIRFVRQLTIETDDPKQFFTEGSATLVGAKALERVTFVRVGRSKPCDAWWREWDEWMELYDLDGPFPFDMRVINGDDRADIEFQQDKYVKPEPGENRGPEH
jgi:hypothetical protein